MGVGRGPNVVQEGVVDGGGVKAPARSYEKGLRKGSKDINTIMILVQLRVGFVKHLTCKPKVTGDQQSVEQTTSGGATEKNNNENRSIGPS